MTAYMSHICIEVQEKQWVTENANRLLVALMANDCFHR